MNCSTVNVAVRIRPLVSYALENESETCVAVVPGKEKVQVLGNDKSYRFDHVLGPDVTNESLYNTIIRNKVAEVFNDRDVTILAYGQRRSGKTHTMGTNYRGEDNMGIIPRAINTLFNVINSNAAHNYRVTVKFTELYNKALYDLLATNKEGTERIVELNKNELKVSGLTEIEVRDVDSAMKCLVEGSQQRVTSEKSENSQSTRSHAVFTITIHQRKNVDPRITTTSQLHLVDLAGSKHGKKNWNKARVNKDLWAMRSLINHEEKEKSDTNTKYHSSKLAILLRESLRKNPMVLIIACVNSARYCLVETLQTLRYANRLRKIKSDFGAKQTDPVENKTDINSIETKPNVVNGFRVQQTTSTMDVPEADELETHDNSKAAWILNAQDFNDSSKSEPLNWFERELDISTEDAQNILTAKSSSTFGDCTYEMSEDDVDENWDASLINNALEANESSTIELEKFQNELGNDLEALLVIPNNQRNLNAQELNPHTEIQRETFQGVIDDDWGAKLIQKAKKSDESSGTKQENFQRGTEDDITANRICDDENSKKGHEIQQEKIKSKMADKSEFDSIRHRQMSNESNAIAKGKFEIQHNTFQSEIDANSETEAIQDVQKLSKSSETNQKKCLSLADDEKEAQSISDALESSQSRKFEQKIVKSDTNDNMKGDHICNNLEFYSSSKYCEEMFQAVTDNATDADSFHNILESRKYSKSEQEIVQNGTNEDIREEQTQDASESIRSSKSSKIGQDWTQTRPNDDTNSQSNATKALESSEFRRPEKKSMQSEKIDDFEIRKTRIILKGSRSKKSQQKMIKSKINSASDAQSIQNAQVSKKISKSTTKTLQNKMDAESIEATQRFGKFSEAQRENIATEGVEDSPSRVFSKIADFFLKPSPTEKNELRKEIRNLRKNLRDRTAKLGINMMDDLNLHERVGLSTSRRENAKLVVAKILEEFQEVLAYIVENSEIKNWIVRVFRRIHDLLDEQKKITGKMLNCKVVNEKTMNEKCAEHTMRQVDRYHEIQGVNRCIALLEELVASLPKKSTIGGILKNLEDMTNEIKKLEIEKVDLVEVLKSAEPLNENRTLAEYGIDKVLELDEKISRLWRRRIKHMIAIERMKKFDRQVTIMSSQIETLKSTRVRLVGEMRDAGKRWNLASTTGDTKKTQNRAKIKKAKDSKVLQKCACKVLECLSRRCSCVKNGMSCIDCNCNAELCQNSDKENSNISNDSQTFPNLPTNNDLKCACTTDCSNRQCMCGKNGVICNENCTCRLQFCKNKKRENGIREANFYELQAPSTSIVGKMEVDRTVSSLYTNSCMCRENGVTFTNCNCSFKLRDYRAKARRRLFVDIDNVNETNEGSRKRPP